MGPMEVPVGAYYGASTQRAVLNFPISTLRFTRPFIRVLGLIKGAAAQVNADLGLLDPKIAEAVQTGGARSGRREAGRALCRRHLPDWIGYLDEHERERGHRQPGDGDPRRRRAPRVHPNDDVNKGQSSNDVIPTAIHVSALVEIEERLIPALERLEAALRGKSEEFWGVVKTGRTHLQDATPVRLGQEFLGYAGQVERGIRRARAAQAELSEVALGGTAVGTGVNTHPEFAARVCGVLSRELGVTVRETENHFQAQNTLDGVLQASASLRTIAVSMQKIANDIRWLGSGPRAGIGEIALPEVQPGSSIMPGKVNPVIAESVLQAVAQVIGNDAAVLQAAQGGVFELNMMMPVAAHNLLESVALLSASADNFAEQCVKGLTGDGARACDGRARADAGHGARAGGGLRPGGRNRKGSGEDWAHDPRGCAREDAALGCRS